VATGTVMGRATAAIGRTPGSNKTFGSFESKFGHLFFQVVLFALRATNDLIGFENNGFKILVTIQTGIFINRHLSISFF
jgi:hypothetical protein